MFTRTASGIQNYALFYSCETIVYIEGGCQTLSASQHPTSAEDIIFWSTVFKKYFLLGTIKIKPVGSKQNLKKIAHDIVENDLENSLCALDSDYDVLTRNFINDPRVFYTRGYSWENDIFTRGLFIDSLRKTLRLTSLNFTTVEEISDFYADFEIKIKRPVFIDAMLQYYGLGFIKKNESDGGIVAIIGGIPIVSKTLVKNKIKKIRAGNRNKFYSRTKLNIEPFWHCYGHLVAYFFTNLFSFFCQKLSNRKMSFANILDVFLLNFENIFLLTDLEVVSAHYDCLCLNYYRHKLIKLLLHKTNKDAVL